ncbi:Fis family transcriptional regulator [Caballeronia sp. J97]|uniref:Fis family transcriptional regulator n=1 Tax=Caballeronia sp. J97 TaxID=2805429 RepID=UPI002AB03B13|nr:Fis family transcriptional regulator [Caballeronia sp. J97]
MPVSKKRKAPKRPARVPSKRYLLPMPRQEADGLCLQTRLALEAARSGRAAGREITVLAQAVLLTSFVTESGHGLLPLSLVRQVEEAVLAILDAGKKSGGWSVNEEIIESLTVVVNEHDRQLREVRISEIVSATERLDKMILTAS